MLLDDKSAGVLGAAAAAFTIVCPENFRIVASRYRELCKILPDVEEWGQVLLVDILLRYNIAVHGYPKKSDIQGKHMCEKRSVVWFLMLLQQRGCKL